MHLVQVLLPLADNSGEPFPSALFQAVRRELTDRFGGITTFTQAPAEGFWKQGTGASEIVRDDIVIFEVMLGDLDRAWWRNYRTELEQRFAQDVILIRAQAVQLL